MALTKHYICIGSGILAGASDLSKAIGRIFTGSHGNNFVMRFIKS